MIMDENQFSICKMQFCIIKIYNMWQSLLIQLLYGLLTAEVPCVAIAINCDFRRLRAVILLEVSISHLLD